MEKEVEKSVVAKEVRSESKDSVKNEPKSPWKSFCCGGCVTLLVLAIVAFVAPRYLGGFSLSNITKSLDNIGKEEVSTQTPKKANKSYSPMSKNELINYFATETTTYGDNTVKLSRWDKDIRIKIEGEPNAEYLAELDSFISRFNTNSTSIKMFKVSSDSNLTIRFGTGNKIGLAAFSAGDDCKIDGALVEVGPEADMVETLPDYIVNHEMFHALGFGGHYRSEESCTLMSAWHCSDSFTKNEDRLIQMMYNSKIPVCSDANQIKTFFASNFK
ncbi:MAG TPA: hypothetical protein PK263_03300 [bacterium]|nr:hypothetical protein [bacterium]